MKKPSTIKGNLNLRSNSPKMKRGGLSYGNQRIETGQNIIYNRNNEDYEYIILGMPGWFEINGYNVSELNECWVGNPCGLNNNSNKNKTCVITRGYGAGEFNGKRYPRGFCIDSNNHLNQVESDYYKL